MSTSGRNATAAALSARRGEYSVLEVALPGREPEPAGVVLHDLETGELDLRLRRDWPVIAGDDEGDVLDLLEDDLREQARRAGPQAFFAWMEDTFSNLLRVSDREPALVGNFAATLNRLYARHVSSTVQEFRTHLPVYSCRAAAGKFGENILEIEPEGWVETPRGVRLSPDMFIATVTGRSMAPRIPDPSRCIFRHGVVGSRENKLVLVEDRRESEAAGERYTVKRYRSQKAAAREGEWRHARIVLEPLNPEYEPIEISEDQQDQVRVIAEFVRVLD